MPKGNVRLLIDKGGEKHTWHLLFSSQIIFLFPRGNEQRVESDKENGGGGEGEAVMNFPGGESGK